MDGLAVASYCGWDFFLSVAKQQAGFAGGLARKSVVSAQFGGWRISGFGAFWWIQKLSETAAK